ncbi:hypothetical protein C1645_763248 [Glomus cerebriforme]|uniref:Uncharacterized protein n=1 Tax=Glomus cerebriforme TaxID=658196 RepID=A0A397T490_9GLOM|nr:hypothetical protein C1645_763248 [Glomus cerebriforme]
MHTLQIQRQYMLILLNPHFHLNKLNSLRRKRKQKRKNGILVVNQMMTLKQSLTGITMILPYKTKKI